MRDAPATPLSSALLAVVLAFLLFHATASCAPWIARLRPSLGAVSERRLEAASSVEGREVVARGSPAEAAAGALAYAAVLLLVLGSRVAARPGGDAVTGRLARREDVAWSLRACGLALVALVLAGLAAGAAAARAKDALPLRLAVDAASTPALDTTVGTILTAVVMVVLAPLAEEGLFRGILFRSLRARLSFPWAAIVQAAAFAAWHLPLARGFSVTARPEAHLLQYAFALLAALVVERRGSLLPALLLHATGNALGLALLLAATHRAGVALRFFGG